MPALRLLALRLFRWLCRMNANGPSCEAELMGVHQFFSMSVTNEPAEYDGRFTVGRNASQGMLHQGEKALDGDSKKSFLDNATHRSRDLGRHRSRHGKPSPRRSGHGRGRPFGRPLLFCALQGIARHLSRLFRQYCQTTAHLTVTYPHNQLCHCE